MPSKEKQYTDLTLDDNEEAIEIDTVNFYARMSKKENYDEIIVDVSNTNDDGLLYIIRDTIKLNRKEYGVTYTL